MANKFLLIDAQGVIKSGSFAEVNRALEMQRFPSSFSAEELIEETVEHYVGFLAIVNAAMYYPAKSDQYKTTTLPIIKKPV